MVYGSIESNLIISPASKAGSNPLWPRVVTPDIAALKSVTPTVIDMGLGWSVTSIRACRKEKKAAGSKGREATLTFY